jgi:hypothetical protein
MFFDSIFVDVIALFFVPLFVYFFCSMSLPMVFLSSVAFYPVIYGLLVFLSEKSQMKKELDLAQKTSLVVAALIIFAVLVSYFLNFSFINYYVQLFIVLFAIFELIVNAVKHVSKNIKKYSGLVGLSLGAMKFSALVSIVAFLFGCGLLTEASMLLNICIIMVMLGLINLYNFEIDYIDTIVFGRPLRTMLFVLFNPVSAILHTLLFVLNGFDLLSFLALSQPLIAAIWVLFIAWVSIVVVFVLKNPQQGNSFGVVVLIAAFVFCCVVYVVASLVLFPSVGLFAALLLGLDSCVVWASVAATPFVVTLLLVLFECWINPSEQRYQDSHKRLNYSSDELLDNNLLLTNIGENAAVNSDSDRKEVLLFNAQP